MSQKVVAHFIDHVIVKGTSADVDPSRTVCHIQHPEKGTVEVDLTQVKALFFVKDYAGRPEYNERKTPIQGDVRLRGSRTVALQFTDGEEFGCLMNAFPPKRKFFFVVPMDPESNNTRVLVNRDAIVNMQEVKVVAPPERLDPGSAAPAPAPAPKRGRTTWVFDGKDIREIDVD